MTGPEARQLGLGWALKDLDDRLAKFVDEQPVDVDDLDSLPCYEKP